MNRKKIWYIPGFISLIGLPMLFLMYPVEDKPCYTTIRHFLPSDEPSDYMFSKYRFYETIKDKKIVTVNLWENSFQTQNNLRSDAREIKRRFIHDEMLRLQLTHDTDVILKVELGNENTYGDFVWLANEALVLNVRRYLFADNCFYFVPNATPEKTTPGASDFGTLVPAIWHPMTEWDVFKYRFRIKLNEVLTIARKNNLLVAGFIVLIIIPAVVKTAINRRKRTQTVLSELHD